MGVGASKVLPVDNEIKELKQQVNRLSAELVEVRGRLSKQTKTFRVAQYNILAGYLGDNRQPWFLYGVSISQERRDAIMKKFYEKGPDGKFANAGWPKYVDGILSEEEQAQITAYHEKYFKWENRRPALMSVIEGCDADLLSLVECDYYDDFFKPCLLYTSPSPRDS